MHWQNKNVLFPDKFPNNLVKNKYYVRIFTSVHEFGQSMVEIYEMYANITSSQAD